MRFCIEAKEHLSAESELPVNKASWTHATRICEAMGARLCTAAEWQFACEGEEMRPYPYGWERDSTACNVDIGEGLGRVGRLADHRAPAGAFPRCLSAFGVHGMAGNVDEWVTIEGRTKGKREVMKGSWWIPGKHVCRAEQAGHGAHYGGTETGVRCCRDAKGT
jgi:formylglycine-generating enzyme required for sulfatase activity